MSQIEVEEINVEIQLKSIAGKWWGSKEKRPILLLHGWLHNAASFDTLVPLLPSKYSYLAIDLPGHGFSSHLPKGCFYHIADYIAILDGIRSKFKWEKLSLLGHSMGGTLAFAYSSLFPDQVDLVCTIDGLRPQPLEKFSLHLTTKHMKNAYASKNESHQRPKEYTYDQMKKIISCSTIDPDKAVYLLKRDMKASKRNPNKFQFTHDIRLHYIQLFNMEHKNSLQCIQHIRAPFLCIHTGDPEWSEDPETFDEALDTFRKHNTHFEVAQFESTHHLHLNNPGVLAGKISDFLTKYHIEEDNTVNCLQPMSRM